MTYLPNPDFEDEYRASSEALELVGEVAEAIAEVAADIAPEDQGYLSDGIEAVAGMVDNVATGRVNSTDFKGHWHEFGTRHHEATPYLRPAAEKVTGGPVKGARS